MSTAIRFRPDIGGHGPKEAPRSALESRRLSTHRAAEPPPPLPLHINQHETESVNVVRATVESISDFLQSSLRDASGDAMTSVRALKNPAKFNSR
jgi:hypothetical protein